MKPGRQTRIKILTPFGVLSGVSSSGGGGARIGVRFEGIGGGMLRKNVAVYLSQPGIYPELILVGSL